LSNPILSIVVCTYNRTEHLSGCLQSLADQTIDSALFEVIIVDNGPFNNDDVSVNELVPIKNNMRIVREYRLGLSYARNLGWEEAEGEYVAFIDDDARACPDWIQQILSFIKRRPEIRAFGGPYEAFTRVKPPDWFPPEYGRFDYGSTERPLVRNKEWINGTNMVFSKDLLIRFGGFNTRLGMRGRVIDYGEDTFFVNVLMDAGIDVYYVPAVKVKHLLPEYKMHLKWMLISRYRSGLKYNATFNKNLKLLDYIAIIVKSFFRAVNTLVPPYKAPFKRCVYTVFEHLFFAWGTIIEKLANQTPKIRRTTINEITSSQ
jgi:glucosyl-dolichyl phosphate glucuronosyltransferase